MMRHQELQEFNEKYKDIINISSDVFNNNHILILHQNLKNKIYDFFKNINYLSLIDIDTKKIDLHKQQISLINPNLIICIGNELKDLFEIDVFNKFIKKNNIFFYCIDSIDSINNNINRINEFFKLHAIIKVTNKKIYYRDFYFQKKYYNNNEDNSFCFIRTDEKTQYKNHKNEYLKKIKRINGINNTQTYENHLTKKDLFYYNNINNIQHSKMVRCAYLDIENDFCNDIINTQKTINCISFYDTLNKKYYTLVLNINNQKIITTYFNSKIKIFDDEKEMLKFCFKLFKEFDIITGWFSNFFDMPYLLNRAKLLGIDLSEYFESLYIKIENKDVKIYQDTNILYDSADFYKMNVYYNKPPNYSLDTVAKFLFGDEVGKIAHANETGDLWRNDINKLIEYNIHDVYLLKKIIEANNIINYPLNLQQICPQDFENVFYNSKTIENLLHHRYWQKNIYFPSKTKHEKRDFEGGIVNKPISGIHKNVAVLDYAAMYTNIYLSFNYSADTLIGEKKYVEDNFEEIKNDLIKRYPEFNIKFNKDKKEILNEWILIENDFGEFYYLSKSWKIGILPALEKEMLSLRKQYKNERDKYDEDNPQYKIYDELQGTAKTILNSIYGIGGFEMFILYNDVVASSITSTARKLNLWAQQKAKEKDYIPLYGDSVEDNTTLLIKYKNNIFTKTIKELITDFKTTHTVNEKDFFILQDDIKVLSFNFKSNEYEFKKIKTIIRHKTNKKISRKWTRQYIINITEEHSVFDVNGQLLDAKNIDDKTQINNKRINLQFTNKIKNIDLLTFFNEYLNYIRNKKRKNNIKKYSIELSKYDDKYIYFFIRKGQKESKIKRYLDINEDFGSVLGYFIAEGSTTYNGFSGFRISNGDIKLQDYYCKLLNKIFDTNEFQLLNNNWNITFKHNYISFLFSKLCGITSKNKKIPDFILETNKDFFEGILRGYIDGDGNKNQRNDNFMNFGGAGSKSKLLISQIYFILKNIYNYKSAQLKLKSRKDKDFYSLNWVGSNNNFYNGKIIKDKKKSLSKIKNNFYKIDYDVDYVYDLSVEDNENFIDICGNVVMHNTDSFFVSIPQSNTFDEFVEMSKILEKDINNSFKEFIRQFTNDEYTINTQSNEIEFEKAYSKLFLADVKKRYFGEILFYKGKILNKSHISITGFETRRDDTPNFFKKHLEQIYILFLNDNYEELINKYYINIKELIKHCKIEDLIIKTKLSRDVDSYTKNMPIHLRALNNSKTEIRRGDFVNMIYVKDSREVLHYDKLLNLKFEIDYDKYINNFFINKMKLIDKNLNFDNQYKLNKWFK